MFDPQRQTAVFWKGLKRQVTLSFILRCLTHFINEERNLSSRYQRCKKTDKIAIIYQKGFLSALAETLSKMQHIHMQISLLVSFLFFSYQQTNGKETKEKTLSALKSSLFVREKNMIVQFSELGQMCVGNNGSEIPPVMGKLLDGKRRSGAKNTKR